MKWLSSYIKKWWRKHICDEVPEELADEFSEKYRK